MTMASTNAPGGTFRVAERDIARIGYGMGGLTRRVTDDATRRDAVALLRRAAELGVQHFDTAQFYGAGLANSLLHEAFDGDRSHAFFATKAGTKPVDGMPPLTAAQKPSELREAVEANLAALGVDQLDLVYLRRMDMAPGLIAQVDQVVDLDDQLAEMTALRDEGLIAAIGLSHVTLDQLNAALPTGVAAVSNIHSLVKRDSEPLLDVCREHSIAWAPYFPLGGGGGYVDLPKAVDEPAVQGVARELSATPTQVAIAWQLQHAPNTLVITGTGSIAHLEENVAAGELELSDEQKARLDEVWAG